MSGVIVAADNCLAAEASVLDTGYNIVRTAQLLLGTITTVLLLRIVWSCKNNPVKLHGNLIILLVNVLILYAIYVWSFMAIAIRNFFLMFAHKNGCDCLNPVWLVYLVRMPFYVYIAASPMFHFAIMAERVWATVFIRSYEKQRHKYGILSAAIVWFITFLFGIYVFLSTIEDTETFGQPLVYFSLTNQYNSNVLINVHYFFLLLVLCISAADYALIRMNRRIKTNFSSRTHADYSLSRSYQANENLLTMRTIFPLDFSYSFVFTIFNILSSFIRSKREEYGLLVYLRTYEAFTLLLFIHAIITLVVYEQFLKGQRRRWNDQVAQVDGPKKVENADVYFKNLRTQWEN